MRAKTLVIFVLMLVLLGLPQLGGTVKSMATQRVSNLQAVYAYLESKLKEYRIPGLALAVVKGNEIIHLISHSGANANYSSNITLIPDENLGIALLINVYPGIMGKPINQIDQGILSLLVNRPVPVINNDLLSQLQVIVLPIILALQLLGFFRAWIVLRRWHARPQLLPKGKKSLLRHIIIPLVVDIAIATFLLIGLPILFDIPLPVMLFFQPDLIGFAILCGILAMVGGLVRSIAVLQLFKRN